MKKDYSNYRKEINERLIYIRKNLPKKFNAKMFVDILQKIEPPLYSKAMKDVSEPIFIRWIAWYYIPQELVRKGFVIRSILSSIRQNNKRDDAFSKLWIWRNH